MFKLFKNRIVQFNDGKFGVQVNRGLFKTPGFQGRDNESSWTLPSAINRFCKIETIDEAKSLLDRININYSAYKPANEKTIKRFL